MRTAGRARAGPANDMDDIRDVPVGRNEVLLSASGKFRDREQVGHMRCWGGPRGGGGVCALDVVREMLAPARFFHVADCYRRCRSTCVRRCSGACIRMARTARTHRESTICTLCVCQVWQPRPSNQFKYQLCAVRIEGGPPGRRAHLAGERQGA
eukprot:gene13610-biopygen2010